MSATVADPAWLNAYNSGSIGGLLGQALAPVGGFGKFCLVLLALSIVANNIPNNYSVIRMSHASDCSSVCPRKYSVTGLPKSRDSSGQS
jgi:purine-cytosine permease-like protein